MRFPPLNPQPPPALCFQLVRPSVRFGMRQQSRQSVRWLRSRVVSVLDSDTIGPAGFKSQPRRCRVTVLGKLFTPIVPLFTKQRNW